MSSQRDALNVSHEGRRQMMYPSRPLPSGPFSCLRHTHRLWFAQESKHEGSLFPVPFTFTHSCKHIAQRHCHLFLFTASRVVVFFFLIHHYRVFLIVFVLLLLLNHSASPKTNPGPWCESLCHGITVTLEAKLKQKPPVDVVCEICEIKKHCLFWFVPCIAIV